jgi:rare lipoprotein A
MVRIRNTKGLKAGAMSTLARRVRSGAAFGMKAMCFAPFAICALVATPLYAASINSEASAPRGPASAATRAPTMRPAPAANPITNASGDGIPDQSWGGPRLNRPVGAIPRAQIRQVNVPVLGREGPAARAVLPKPLTSARPVAAKPAVAARPVASRPVANQPVPPKPPVAAPTGRPITITASEPTLTSIVRPQDVARFQKIGSPYQVNGTWYVPAHEPDYNETGVASWYGADFQGRPTANGEIFDMNVVSGAHPTLPIPSLVEVTNLTNGRSIVVRINDRGPFVSSRLIDMSARGAELLGFKQQGHANVRVRYVGPATPEPVVTADNISTGRASVVAQATPPTNPAANGQAFVQVGAFSQLANAERARDQAINLGPVRLIQTAQADGNPLYRVVLGPVSSRMEADVKAQEMSTNGFSGARVLASLN